MAKKNGFSENGIETVDDNTKGGKTVVSIMIYVTLDFVSHEPDVPGLLIFLKIFGKSS